MSTLSLSEVKAVVKELPHPILISTSLSWAEKTLCPVTFSHWPRTCVK